MNTTIIEQINRRLQLLEFGDSGRVYQVLMNVSYNMHCVQCSRDVFSKIDLSLLENFSRSASSVQQAGSGGMTVSFSNEEDVEFHTKRLVSDVFIHLKSVLDAVEESIRKIYRDQDHIGPDGLPKTPTRSKLIASLFRSQSNLNVSEFVRRNLMPKKTLIQAMTFIRDEFIHHHYSIFNDLDRRSARQEAESSFTIENRLVFDNAEANAGVFSEWSKEEREYGTFINSCIGDVELIFSSFLNALLTDIKSQDEVPIQFEGGTETNATSG